MNAKRVIGLIVLAMLAAWPILRSCTPEESEPQPPPPPPREEFHAAKPIGIQLAGSDDAAWLEYELRHLLSRGKMRVAALPAPPQIFMLRVTLSADGKQAALALVAPDQVVERESTLPLNTESRFAIIKSFAAALPQFLNAAHTTTDWVALLGTNDATAYDIFLDSALEAMGPDGEGFTQPPSATRRSPTVEKLESMLRRQPRFARGWGVLAASYLTLGGKDELSLTQLAETSAERSLALDDETADAHAALGLVHLRRNEWIAAREQLARALVLDANNAAALEGLGCLLADAGRSAAAEPFAARATTLQPRNAGARECLTFARTGITATPKQAVDATTTVQSPEVGALEAILAGNAASARELLQASLSREDFDRWAEPLLRAADNRRHIPEALQAVTLAASEQQLDPSTEILCGTALRQPEFVFNRMARLQRQRERLPLRVLWMPETQFLRKHPRFEQIVSSAGLPAFWQEEGPPDVCASEPDLYGCKVHPAATTTPKSSRQSDSTAPANR